MASYFLAIDGGARSFRGEELPDDGMALAWARYFSSQLTRADGLPHTVTVHRANGETVYGGSGLIIAFEMPPPTTR